MMYDYGLDHGELGEHFFVLTLIENQLMDMFLLLQMDQSAGQLRSKVQFCFHL